MPKSGLFLNCDTETAHWLFMWLLMSMGWDFVSLAAATSGPFVHPPDDIYVWRATVEWYWQGKTEELGEISDIESSEENCIYC
jgi:hypothetical protein